MKIDMSFIPDGKSATWKEWENFTVSMPRKQGGRIAGRRRYAKNNKEDGIGRKRDMLYLEVSLGCFS